MKGQSAVEYLMTYGWAILALIIVLGALISSGILTPNYLVSEECSFGSNVRCVAAFFNTGPTSQLNINVYNGFPYKIRIRKIEIASIEYPQSFSGFPTDIDIESGSNYTFDGTLSGPSAAANTISRFYGNITYVSCAPEIGPCGVASNHTISGLITAKLIPQ